MPSSLLGRKIHKPHYKSMYQGVKAENDRIKKQLEKRLELPDFGEIIALLTLIIKLLRGK